MARPLAITLRPKKFSELVGQDSLVKAIRGQIAKGTEQSAWMFVGPTGNGKTTVARILALSLQCDHQTEFGEPCNDCQKKRSSFEIREINASQISGVEHIGALAESSVYMPQPPSKKSIYILDEAQRLSSASQNLLLKYFEDAPISTVWMICTTEQNKILETLRRRCRVLELKLLQVNDIEKLVRKALAFISSTKKVDPILNALLAAKIQSSGLILNAIENYDSGMKAKESVKNLTMGSDSEVICKCIEKGDWVSIRKELGEASTDDLKGIRAHVAGYFKGALITMVPGPRATEMARAIDMIAKVDSYTDIVQGPATVAVMYELTQIFHGPEEDQDEKGLYE